MKKSRRSCSSRGFTLIELLVVIAIIGILAAILLPVLSAVKEKEKVTRARRQIAEIAFAISKYEADYNRFPIGSAARNSVAANGDDYTYGGDFPYSVYASGTYRTNNSEVMAVLLDRDQFPNAGHIMNTQRTALLNPPIATDTGAPGLGQDLVYRDPWGNPYVITIDANNDERARDAFYKLPVSIGLNGFIKRDLPNNTTVYEANSPVLVWSAGHDKTINPSVPWNKGVNKDNILSGQ